MSVKSLPWGERQEKGTEDLLSEQETSRQGHIPEKNGQS